jgi:NADPH:quinone reductase-like Zn-dependent oxidoreductase
MKAIIYEKYGPPEVLRLAEVEKPTPKSNEILVRNLASPVSFGDLTARNFINLPNERFYMPLILKGVMRFVFGYRKPKMRILGSEYSGEIEEVGKDVKKFQKGDRVFGYQGSKFGAYAEYLCVPENGIVALKPANMTFTEAAAVPYGAIIARNLLGKVEILPGQKVLVNGASGGIGSAMVQLARYYGAEVTGVCGTPRLEYVKELGADQVIDYNVEDFTQNGKTYDLIIDILGKSTFSRCKNALAPKGVYLLASFKMKPVLQMMWTSLFGSQKVICAFSSESANDLIFVKELAEAGKYKSIVDKVFPMDQASEAHRYTESGTKKGNVIISMEVNK